MSSVLFDTSVAVAHLRKRYDAFARAGDENSNIFISSTALGELRHGLFKARQFERNRAILDVFLRETAILHPDESTTWHYGKIAADLDRRGEKIPTNDIWIAAIALEHELPLATQDSHFLRVDGLEVFLWH